MSATANIETKGRVSSRGIYDSQLDSFWWSEWMLAERGREVIIIRSLEAPKCYANEGETLGKFLGTCALIRTAVVA